MSYSSRSAIKQNDVALEFGFPNKELVIVMDEKLDMYTTALDLIRAQINLITYSNELTQNERLSMLEQLEVDVTRKLGWAKASFSFPMKKKEDALAG